MPPELDDDHVAAICRVLIEHNVRFVVIGGVAARLHETGYATLDVLQEHASMTVPADAFDALLAALD